MQNNKLNSINLDVNIPSIIELMPGYIYWKDLNSIYLGCNQNLAIISNLQSSNDIIGKTDYDFNWGANNAKQFIDDDKFVIETGQTHISEYIMPTKNTKGSNHVVRTEKRPLIGKFGNIIGILAIAIDITLEKENELLALENKAYQSEIKIQQQFKKVVDQVTHDIRSPLASFAMILDACQHIIPEIERKALNQAATRISDIANNLLNYFHLKEHVSSTSEINVYAPMPTLASTNILELLTEKKYQYTNYDIDFVTDFSKTAYFSFINVNHQNFKRSLSNIINNAVDALNEKSGNIIIKLDDTDDKHVKISIIDNGKGIPQTVIDKIRNNANVTSGKKNGHGIGLEQVREMLATSNGKLLIESSLSIGTSIHLFFPKIELPSWITKKIELNPDDLVIILDDDLSIHGAWEARFKQSVPDIRRKHFEDGNEVVTFINNLSIDEKRRTFLLTDYELLKQNLNGLDVIKRTQIIRSVLVTSHYNTLSIHEQASFTNTKILPKLLASEVPIIVSW